jgi:hypothetical protein
LNQQWIESDGRQIGPRGVFPFVITGQTIDRKLYDNLNSYTGEAGSDGVVRVAAADLNAAYVRLEQQVPQPVAHKPERFEAPRLEARRPSVAPETATRIVAGKSHSGTSKGIMRSVKAEVGRSKDAETVNAILDCMEVRTRPQYTSLARRFTQESAHVQDTEKTEFEKRFFATDTWFFNDRHSMVIFRVRDHEGFPVEDFDLLLTAGKDNDPNHLPKGFFVDRQANSRDPGTITYYFDYDAMVGCPARTDAKEREIRPALPGTDALGIRVTPRPTSGFVQYMPCAIKASKSLLSGVIGPNQTTLVDIVLRRVVGKNVFRVDRTTKPRSFKNVKPGEPLRD